MTEGPFTAHQCAESEHHREEANRLRELLGKLEASSDVLAAQLAQAIKERDEWVLAASCAEGSFLDEREQLAKASTRAEQAEAELATTTTDRDAWKRRATDLGYIDLAQDEREKAGE